MDKLIRGCLNLFLQSLVMLATAWAAARFGMWRGVAVYAAGTVLLAMSSIASKESK